MKFEVGKTYWTLDKRGKVKIIAITEDLPAERGYTAIVGRYEDGSLALRFINGSFNNGFGENSNDLAEEVVEPLSLSQTLWFNIFKFNYESGTEKLSLSRPYYTEAEAEASRAGSSHCIDTISVQMDYTEKTP